MKNTCSYIMNIRLRNKLLILSLLALIFAIPQTSIADISSIPVLSDNPKPQAYNCSIFVDAIQAPDCYCYNEGDTGNTIEWILTVPVECNDSVNATSYTIKKDGVIIDSDDGFTCSITVNTNIDDLSAGAGIDGETYKYLCTYEYSIIGFIPNTATHEVIVTVCPSDYPCKTPVDSTCKTCPGFSSIIIVAGLTLFGIVIALRKNGKKIKT
ncbi:MAG: hypothetical protein H7641_02770 [Candidatus Heimdallarchaeota archaeon]|nr:hypothetical protein [Candidatus Heimdallarchaeota archaeon]MCK4876486.1 hypothetical protein [Candidatus Heimdallarchaeota archaeon]